MTFEDIQVLVEDRQVVGQVNDLGWGLGETAAFTIRPSGGYLAFNSLTKAEKRVYMCVYSLLDNSG